MGRVCIGWGAGAVGRSHGSLAGVRQGFEQAPHLRTQRILVEAIFWRSHGAIVHGRIARNRRTSRVTSAIARSMSASVL